MRNKYGAAAAALAAAVIGGSPAQAQDRYLGEVFLFAGNFCPRGSAPAQGQLLPIAQNTALFSLLGTIYGGDGRTTFALPDLRGRSAVNVGQAPGLSDIKLGQRVGTEGAAVSSSLSLINAGVIDPNALVDGAPGFSKVQIPAQAGGGSGGGSNRPPQLGMHYCIVLAGTYPSRN